MSYNDEDQEKIRIVFEEKYSNCVRNRDLDGYGELYTEDALWMSPNVADRRGIPDIKEGFSLQIANQNIDPTFTADEIEVMGETGYVVGMSEARISPLDGNPPKIVKYRALWVMKKKDETWKIDRQIWNVKP